MGAAFRVEAGAGGFEGEVVVGLAFVWFEEELVCDGPRAGAHRFGTDDLVYGPVSRAA